MTNYAELVKRLRFLAEQHSNGNGWVDPFPVGETLAAATADAIEMLQSWQYQMMAIQSTWDVQSIGRLLKLPLGINILPAIQPAIESLIKENEMLKKRLAEAGWREEYRRNMNI